jgi:hypothetical protein
MTHNHTSNSVDNLSLSVPTISLSELPDVVSGQMEQLNKLDQKVKNAIANAEKVYATYDNVSLCRK